MTENWVCMSFFSSAAWLFANIAALSDLQFKETLLSGSKMRLSNVQTQLTNEYNALDPASASGKVLAARIKQLQRAETAIDLEISRIQTQVKQREQARDQAKQQVEKAIKQSFGVLGQSGEG
jgi:hypothetical protein